MRLMLLVLACVVGCDDPEPEVSETETETETQTETESETEAVDDDPLAGLDDIEALENEAPDPSLPNVSTDTVQAAVPPRGCATFGEEATRLWPRNGPANVVAVGEDGFVIAGYSTKEEGAGEEVWVVRAKPGSPPSLLLRDDLEQALSVPRNAAPGLGRVDNGHIGLVTVDGSANVRMTVIQTGGRVESWRQVGNGADQRFTPAFGVRGNYQYVAYTEGRAEGMRTHAIAFEPTGRLIRRYDLTPEGSGAAASTFVDGSNELLFVDPREAVSPMMQVSLDEGAGEASVLLPLSNIFEPVALAPVKVGERFLVGYTAMGMAAATAVGLVAIEGEQSHGPVPIVPSSGYGYLHVSGAAGPNRAVFVADRPKARERGAPREAVVVVVDPSEDNVQIGAPKVLTTPDETARWSRIARHGSGTYAVVMTGSNGVYAHFLRCDEGE